MDGFARTPPRSLSRTVHIPPANLLGEENAASTAIMENFENERICIGGICAGESANGDRSYTIEPPRRGLW